MNRIGWAAVALVGALGATGAIASAMTSCASSPNIPSLRSFETAKFVDVVCLQVLTAPANGGVGGIPITPPIPVDQQLCAPVPVNQVGADLSYHLFALVTQTIPGEVAVVDLTAGHIVDEDPATPGVDFLVVGANPAGIAAAPNGAMTFVTSADPYKPAIYGLPSVRILGAAVTTDGGVATVYGGADAQAPVLPDWPACSLPQTPGPIVAIPQDPLPPDAASQAEYSQGYILAVVLPGDPSTGQAARVVTIDPRPLLRGGGIDIGPGPVVPPGSLAPCPILGEIPLSGLPRGAQLPAKGGPAWDDGVKYVIEGGPPVGSNAALAAGYVGPSRLPLPSFSCVDGGAASATETGTSAPALPMPPPQATAAVRAGHYLYVGDRSLPLIHVIDLAGPEPQELAPLFATSLSQPSRPIWVGALAISPPTRDFKRYLYALDQTDSPASIIVYDVSDPLGSPHVPLTRPHGELTPQLPLDRIQFTAPVAALAFASHDFPLTQNSATGGNIVGAAASGLLCNPNPIEDGGEVVQSDGEVTVDASFSEAGLGALYRNNFQVQQISLGPGRLRGVFGFATLTGGEVMLIDVDDWDSPCRRPISMISSNVTSDIAPPELPTPPRELEDGGDAALVPYQVPDSGSTGGVFWVTDETFFPVSQPHRPRSFYPLDNDPILGIHYPQVLISPQLYDLPTGAILPAGADAGNPLILPTSNLLPGDAGQLADPSGYDGGTGVRLAWEDPLVHLNQSWTITYEGQLPTFGSGIVASVETNPSDSPHDSYETLVLSFPSGGQLCERGVEDLTVGRERVAAAKAAQGDAQFPGRTCKGLSNDNCGYDMSDWVGDYVQITDNLLPESDPYWSLPDDDACWDQVDVAGRSVDPKLRFEYCANYYQPPTSQQQSTAPRLPLARDFPILEAYDDRLVISRFVYPQDDPVPGMDAAAFPVPESTTNRRVWPPDPSNQTFLKTMRCCFHSQIGFSVRAGGEWLAVGSVSSLLHHVTTDASNRCVLSCNSQEALLNSRSLGFFLDNRAAAPDRNSPLAMRNPMFAYYVEHPLGPAPTLAPNDPRSLTPCTSLDQQYCSVQRVARDLSWEFSTVNAFTNQLVNLAGGGVQLSPQSMLFIPSLGQLAVVDGAQEGLVLIDLGTIAVTGNPYN
jgi:hypothetical protein